MFTAFLIKYAEIGIKGRNRYLFEDALVRQIKYALKRCDGAFEIRKTMGRIFVEAQSAFDFDETVEQLRRVFGIWGICPVIYVEDQGWGNSAGKWWLIWERCIPTKTERLRSMPGAAARTIPRIPWRSTGIWVR